MNIRLVYISLVLAGLILPAGVPAASSGSDDGWQHGSLFSAPNWLLEQFDDDSRDMSNLDYFGTKISEPTEKPPTYAEYITQGWGYLDGGNYRDAGTAFDNAITLNESSTDAWYGKGLALEKQKRYLSAIDAYKNAVIYSKKPVTSWGPNAGIGRTSLSLQRFEEAKDAFTLSISQYEQAGVSSPDEISSIYRDLAQALEMLGETDAAQEALDKAGNSSSS
jgi:tetratricopeptide (TPR) repeat protein